MKQDAWERICDLLGIGDEKEDAQDTLVYILERKGYRLLENPRTLMIGDEVKVDVVLQVETPDGERIFVLADAQARVHFKELRRWSSILKDPAFQQQLTKAGVGKPLLPYLFGMRVCRIVDDEARRLGIGVLDPDGERVEPAMFE